MKILNVNLQEALSKIPIVSKQNVVNVFGIVCAFDANKRELSVYDHTRDIFRIEIVTTDSKVDRIIDERTFDKKDKRKRIVIRVGDIVFIKRLVISSDFSFKTKSVKDIIVLNIFSDDYKQQSIHSSIEPFSDDEMQILSNLKNYQSKRLFDSIPERRSHKNDYLQDLVFEVLYIERRSDRTIFVGWNGNSHTDFKSENLASLENLWYGISLNSEKSRLYDYDFLKNIHKEDLFVNVTVFDPFLTLTNPVRLFDYIFMPKVLIAPSKYSTQRYFYRYNFALQTYRTIQICHPRSSMGRELSSRIEQYFLIEEKPIDQSSMTDSIIVSRLSPIPLESNDDSESFSLNSYFPTNSTPIRTSSTYNNKQRSVIYGTNVIQRNSLDYFSESSPKEGDSSLKIEPDIINERIARVLYRTLRASYPFDLDRYENLKVLTSFPNSIERTQDNEEQEMNKTKEFFKIDAMYRGFIKNGCSQKKITIKDYDLQFFYEQILQIKCSHVECQFVQSIYEYFRFTIPDDLLEVLNDTFYCTNCGWPKYCLTILLSLKIQDTKNNLQIVHIYGDIAEKLFGLKKSHFRSDLNHVFTNIRNMLLHLDYYSINQNYCRSFIEWILKPTIFNDYETFYRLQVQDFIVKPSMSLGHRL